MILEILLLIPLSLLGLALYLGRIGLKDRPTMLPTATAHHATPSAETDYRHTTCHTCGQPIQERDK